MMTPHRIRMGHRPQWRQKQKHCFTAGGEMRQKSTQSCKCDNNVSLHFSVHTSVPPTPSLNSPFNTNFVSSHFKKNNYNGKRTYPRSQRKTNKKKNIISPTAWTLKWA